MTILEILKKDLINSYLKIENDYKRITNVTTINDQIVLFFTDNTTIKIGLNDDLDLCGETGYKIRQLINK